jgi:hypothetical protein
MGQGAAVIQFLNIDPRTMLDDARPKDIVGKLSRLLKERNPGLTIDRARDISLAAVYGALADAKGDK